MSFLGICFVAEPPPCVPVHIRGFDMKRSLLPLVTFSVLAVAAAPASAGPLLTMTFVNASGTTPSTLTVYGNVLGWQNNHGDYWFDTRDTADLSEWTLLPSLAPSGYPIKTYDYPIVRLYVTSNYFGYGENAAGHYPDTLEAWGRSANVGQIASVGTGSFFTLLGVEGAFAYRETSYYATNWDPDDPSGAIMTRLDANGTLTLADYTYCDDCGPDAPVPEPASLVLFGSGLAGLVGVARRRK